MLFATVIYWVKLVCLVRFCNFNILHVDILPFICWRKNTQIFVQSIDHEGWILTCFCVVPCITKYGVLDMVLRSDSGCYSKIIEDDEKYKPVRLFVVSILKQVVTQLEGNWRTLTARRKSITRPLRRGIIKSSSGATHSRYRASGP